MTSSTERVRRWREINRDSYNEYMTRYNRVLPSDIEVMLENPDEIWFEREYRKRKNMKIATPDWVDAREIRRIYEECVRLSKKMGMRFSVHHDVPISHRNVCGLHVPANLRVVSERYKDGVGRKFYPKRIEQEMLSANGSPL